jgi:hypothetical protein
MLYSLPELLIVVVVTTLLIGLRLAIRTVRRRGDPRTVAG